MEAQALAGLCNSAQTRSPCIHVIVHLMMHATMMQEAMSRCCKRPPLQRHVTMRAVACRSWLLCAARYQQTGSCRDVRRWCIH